MLRVVPGVVLVVAVFVAALVFVVVPVFAVAPIFAVLPVFLGGAALSRSEDTRAKAQVVRSVRALTSPVIYTLKNAGWVRTNCAPLKG
jgi:hypothetical protein